MDDMLLRRSRGKMENHMRKALQIAFGEDRVVFGENTVTYVDKVGDRQTDTIEEISNMLYGKFDDEFYRQWQQSLAYLGITPDDVKSMLENLKEKGRC